MRTLLILLTMVAAAALTPPAQADPWKDESGHGRRRWNDGRGGGPPPWAPAWGYRRQHDRLFDNDVWRWRQENALRQRLYRRWDQRRYDLQDAYNSYYRLPPYGYQGLPPYYGHYWPY